MENIHFIQSPQIYKNIRLAETVPAANPDSRIRLVISKITICGNNLEFKLIPQPVHHIGQSTYRPASLVTREIVVGEAKDFEVGLALFIPHNRLRNQFDIIQLKIYFPQYFFAGFIELKKQPYSLVRPNIQNSFIENPTILFSSTLLDSNVP